MRFPVTLALLSGIAHAAVEPVSPEEASQELRDNAIAFVEKFDPFTDQSTLSLQVVGLGDAEQFVSLFKETLELHVQTLKAAMEAGVATEELPPLSLPEPTNALFVLECDPGGKLYSFPLVPDEGSNRNTSSERVRLRVDDDPMVELNGVADHHQIQVLLDRLKEAESFIVQRVPATADDPVFRFVLYSDGMFDKRPVIHVFSDRCSARKQ